MTFFTPFKLSLPFSSRSWSVILFGYAVAVYGLALILAGSGIAKLADSSSLLATLQQIAFLNETAIILTTTLLPLLELALAAALFMQWNPPATLMATCLLFTGFLGFAVYGLYASWNRDCGCFGGLADSNFW